MAFDPSYLSWPAESNEARRYEFVRISNHLSTVNHGCGQGDMFALPAAEPVGVYSNLMASADVGGGCSPEARAAY
jgi:hypothetical protein